MDFFSDGHQIWSVSGFENSFDPDDHFHQSYGYGYESGSAAYFPQCPRGHECKSFHPDKNQKVHKNKLDMEQKLKLVIVIRKEIIT